MPELIAPTGAIWIANYKSFLKERTFYGKNYQQAILSWKKGMDIDTKQELEICKSLIKTNNMKKKLVIFGNGNHAKIVKQEIQKNSKLELKAVFDFIDGKIKLNKKI